MQASGSKNRLFDKTFRLVCKLVGVLVELNLGPCDIAVHGCLGDSRGYFGEKAMVEWFGKDVFGTEV